jgi:hypothetical protein
MQAIETYYNGYRFRSRIEAKWAVFYDNMGIPYEYEKEGYNFNGVLYLPDFWLPDQDCWVEIKGENSSDGLEKCSLLARSSGKNAYMFVGSLPDFNGELRGSSNCFAAFTGEEGACDEGYQWCECQNCGCLGIHFGGRSGRLPCKKKGCPSEGDRESNWNSRKLKAAYKIANMARFEHGEKP